MKSMPLYKQIQEDICYMIRSGQLRAGDRVPSETELTEQYHVSKITAKNAIHGLVEEGMLVRHRGKGTFVKLMDEENESMSRHKGLIGLIPPCMKTKVDQHIINAVEQYVRENGYHLLIKITQESALEESRAIEDLLQLLSQSSGRSLELISFDQSELPGVSYVKQNVEEMCKVTVEMLLEQIQGTYNPRRVAVPVTLFRKNILNKI